MGGKFNLDDYNDVASRMAEFFVKYPEGSFQSECQFSQIDGRWAAVVKAQAFRTPDDPRPGNGLAFEFIPGATSFTKDSELQNAETAAWGRAVLAIGAADTKRGIASREEVRNRQAETLAAPPSRPNQAGTDAILKVASEMELPMDALAVVFQERHGIHPRNATNEQLIGFATDLRDNKIKITVDGAVGA